MEAPDRAGRVLFPFISMACWQLFTEGKVAQQSLMALPSWSANDLIMAPQGCPVLIVSIPEGYFALQQRLCR